MTHVGPYVAFINCSSIGWFELFLQRDALDRLIYRLSTFFLLFVAFPGELTRDLAIIMLAEDTGNDASFVDFGTLTCSRRKALERGTVFTGIGSRCPSSA
jgi:hypothetical protein